jgi:D-3-phosphoglycerate dehydrogenase
VIAALILGRGETTPFPGRNVFPVLGRPLMAYPILAARAASSVDRVFFSTDNAAMGDVARRLNCVVLDRPADASSPTASIGDALRRSYDDVVKTLGEPPELLVVLLANAPTVTREMIDEGVESLRRSPAHAAAMSVSVNKAYHPRLALELTNEGDLASFAAGRDLSSEKVLFANALLHVIRPSVMSHPAAFATSSSGLLNVTALRVLPVVHEGYGDIDYAWQVPAVEEWLRRRGFDDARTPYDGPGPSEGARVDVGSWRDRIMKSPADRRVLVTTVPFCEEDAAPLRALESAGVSVVINPHGRRLRAEELAELVEPFHCLVAGTEPITADVMARAPNLRLIARVGIGVDNVDLGEARRRGIHVTYTPEAPAPAVAELTVGLMLSTLRHIARADRSLRNGVWHRFMGRRLAGATVGVVGVGRIGRRVLRHLAGAFPDTRLLAHDLRPDETLGAAQGVHWTSPEELLSSSDVVTFHVPLTPRTRDWVTEATIARMKPSAVLINTSRGGIVRESDLADALRRGRLAAAAVDVFDREPYAGELVSVENCLLTCHMGSMTADCRSQMEREAVEEVERFLSGRPLRQAVPDHEYEAQERRNQEEGR